METRELWAKTLKNLRDKNEDLLLATISNLHVSFTHDEILLAPTNLASFELLEKNKNLLPKNIEIRAPYKTEHKLSLKEKLEKIFGDKLVLE